MAKRLNFRIFFKVPQYFIIIKYISLFQNPNTIFGFKQPNHLSYKELHKGFVFLLFIFTTIYRYVVLMFLYLIFNLKTLILFLGLNSQPISRIRNHIGLFSEDRAQRLCVFIVYFYSNLQVCGFNVFISNLHLSKS